jgi:hypothetical protein
VRLFYLFRTNHVGWDEYDGLVVCAASEEDALLAAEEEHPWVPETPWMNTWAQRENVTVQKLGTADEGVERGIVLGSFNAG